MNIKKTEHINYKSTRIIVFYLLLILILLTYFDTNEAFPVSSPITPTPTMSMGACKSVVTYYWNISGIPNANRAFWELKKGSDFTNLEGPESNRIDRGSSNSLQGSVTIDLRNYGQVLNGTKYFFRVVAKEDTDDVARRSNSVKFELDYSPNNTYSANTFAQDPYQVRLDWSNLKSEIDNCSDRVYYEVKRNSPFTNLTGAESGRIDSGSSTGSFTTINLSGQQPGDYYVRIVGKSGGTSVSDDVGKRGSGIKVTIGQQDTSPPAEHFQPVNITTPTLKMTGLREVPESDSPSQPVAVSEDLVTRPAGNIKVDRSRTINLELNSFKIGDGVAAQNKVQNARYNVPITFKSTGINPAYYRVKTCPITNARWKSLSGSSPTIDLLKEGKIKYCFQLKSSTGVESNILDKNYIVKLVERTIDSDDHPIQYAKQKGFKFGARDLTPNSACGYDFTTETLAWNFSRDVKCKYSLFQGRKLNYPWKVKDVRIIMQSPNGRQVVSRDYQSINFIREPSGDNLYFTFTIEARNQVTDANIARLRYYLFEYVLQGPEDKQWQDAFD